MNEMIERLARTIMIRNGCGQTINGERVYCNDCSCHDEARAYIAAMCEPTDAMICAGDERILAFLNDHELLISEGTPALASWQAMIDEALK